MTHEEKELVNKYLDALVEVINGKEVYNINTVLTQFKHDNNLIIELKDGELYCIPSGVLVVCTNSKRGHGFGFDISGNYSCIKEINTTTWSFKNNPELWQPSTTEQQVKFEKLLFAEADKRGYREEGARFECMHEPRLVPYDGNFTEYSFDMDGLWIESSVSVSLIMNDKGEWSEITRQLDKLPENFAIRFKGESKKKKTKGINKLNDVYGIRCEGYNSFYWVKENKLDWGRFAPEYYTEISIDDYLRLVPTENELEIARLENELVKIGRDLVKVCDEITKLR